MSLKINVDKKPGDVFIFSINGSIDTDTYKELDDRVSP
jgi:anti-anti-sigma regulatory factor